MTTCSGDSRSLGLLSFGTGFIGDSECSGLFGGLHGVAGLGFMGFLLLLGLVQPGLRGLRSRRGLWQVFGALLEQSLAGVIEG